MKKLAHNSRLYFQYLKRTGLFSYLSENLLKLLYVIIGFVAVFFLVDQFVFKIKDLFQIIVDNVPFEAVFGIFALSETILGLLPPDLFIIWGEQQALDMGVSPWFILSILAVLSYVGGILAYFIGYYLQSQPKIHAWIENKHGDLFHKLRKWGGFLIVVAALLPIPFSIITMICGMTKFPFKVLTIVGLFRFLRYALYGVALFWLV